MFVMLSEHSVFADTPKTLLRAKYPCTWLNSFVLILLSNDGVVWEWSGFTLRATDLCMLIVCRADPITASTVRCIRLDLVLSTGRNVTENLLH
jgi:hypothetical protein